jgi:YggT family protein
MIGIITLVLRGLIWLVIIDALLSWVVRNPMQFPRNYTRMIVEPLCAPVQKLLSPQVTGGIDFSPLVVIIVLQFAVGFVARAGL